MINVRHILISPKFSSADLKKAQLELDSIKNQIASGKITFEEAALKFSDDTETKLNGGLLINPATGTTKFDVAEIEPGLFFILDKLKLGEVSDVTKQAGSDNKPAFKLLTIKSKSEPHRANLKDDYQRLQNIALQQKQAKTVNTWINKKRKQSYIKVTEEYMGCQFRNTWFDKEKQQ
jgi:peptidyl-prolyl cis-trans isomerase SurA